MSHDTQGASLPYIDDDIGAHTYRAVRLPLRSWANLSEHLAAMLGKPLGDLFRGRGVDLSDLGSSSLDAVAIAGLLERLTAANMLELLRFAGGSLRVQSANGGFNPMKPDALQLHFATFMRELAPALKLFLLAQYADFFGGLRECFPERRSEPADQEQNTDPSSAPSPIT